MSRSQEYRIVHLDGPAEPEPRVLGTDGQLRPVAEGDGRLPLVALVPAGELSALAVDLPPVTGRKLDQALRWAAEDRLAGAAEDQHVAAAGRSGDGRMRCLVTGRSRMQAWLERLDEIPERLVPDAAALPWQPGQLVLLPVAGADGREDLLARWGEWAFDRFERTLLEDLLPELRAAAGGQAARPVWYGTEPPPGLESAERRPLPAAPLELLAPGAAASPANLMTGEFAAPSRGRALGRWRLAAGLAVAVAALWLGHGALEVWQLRAESARLQTGIEGRFQAAFPDAGPALRPREQAERELARLRYGGSDALELLGLAGPLLGGASGVTVDTLRYRDGELELGLKVADVGDMEALEARLAALGLQARVQGLSLGPDGASGRLRIRRADS